MSDNIENIEIEKEVEEVEVIQPKKKQLSLKQLEHLNNIRVKALEKKREIKLQKNKEYEEKNQKPTVVEEVIKKEKKKPLPIQPPQQVEKSYNELLCESSLERMQSKIMNERAKHLITHIIPTYY